MAIWLDELDEGAPLQGNSVSARSSLGLDWGGGHVWFRSHAGFEATGAARPGAEGEAIWKLTWGTVKTPDSSSTKKRTSSVLSRTLSICRVVSTNLPLFTKVVFACFDRGSYVCL